MVRKIKNIAQFFALLLVGYWANVFAQATATASIGVTIVTPIGITKSIDMDFGNIAVGIASGGTTVLGTDGSRSVTGSVTLPSSKGSPTAASFIVTGSGNYTYTISLPSSPIMLSASTAGVLVDTFISNHASTGTLTAGTQIVNVGATLTIPASAVANTYKNSSGLNVTVNYN